MDLNHIILPASVVAGLYPSSLVQDIAEDKAAPVPITGSPNEVQPAEFIFLGNNQRNVLILVNNPGITHMADSELQFLTGILGACKLSLDDVAILNMDRNPNADYKALHNFFNNKVSLLFDVEPASFGLPMSFPHYQVQSFAGNSYLYSPSLKDLENDKVEKSKLWVCLKKVFNL